MTKTSFLLLDPKNIDLTKGDNYFRYNIKTNSSARQQYLKLEYIQFSYDWSNIRRGINDSMSLTITNNAGVTTNYTFSVLDYLVYRKINSSTDNVNYNIISSSNVLSTSAGSSFISLDKILAGIGIFIKSAFAVSPAVNNVLASDVVDSQTFQLGSNRVVLVTESTKAFTLGTAKIIINRTKLSDMLGFTNALNTTCTSTAVKTLTFNTTTTVDIAELQLTGIQQPIIIPQFFNIGSLKITNANEIYSNDSNLLARVPLGLASHGKMYQHSSLTYAAWEPTSDNFIDIFSYDDFGPIESFNYYNRLILKFKIFKNSIPESVMF